MTYPSVDRAVVVQLAERLRADPLTKGEAFAVEALVRELDQVASHAAFLQRCIAERDVEIGKLRVSSTPKAEPA